jgi:raffinose/stachyose/melibiose transport system permease protein
VARSVGYSFYDWTGPGRPATFIGLDNFVELASDQRFYQALMNNGIIVFSSILFQLPLGLGLAVIINSKLRLKRFWRAVYFLPTLMSTVAIGILWGYIYNPDFGLINGFLAMIGLDGLQQGWLGNSSTALGAVVVTTVWQWAPFYMIIYSAGIASLPLDIYEAAKLDGANKRQEFFLITLPLLRPVIITTIVLSVIGSIKYFDLVYIMTGGGPSDSTQLLATLMFKEGFTNFRFGYASAIAVAMLCLSLVVTAFVLARSRRSKIPDGGRP